MMDVLSVVIKPSSFVVRLCGLVKFIFKKQLFSILVKIVFKTVICIRLR